MDRIPCGMYRIKSDNSIEKLKEPKLKATRFAERQENVSYAEMIPGSEEEVISLQSKYLLMYKLIFLQPHRQVIVLPAK